MPVPAKPFEQMDSNDRSVWLQESERYDLLREIYEREWNGMIAMWTTIQNTVSQKHRYILNLNISERQRMIKLRDRLKPDRRYLAANLRARFQELGPKKRNESVEKWLSEWENVIRECEDAGLIQYTGYVATVEFINAIEPLLPMYAEIRHAKLDEDPNLSFFEEIKAFRRRWDKQLSKEKRSSGVFATSEGICNQSNRSSQPRKCICGDFHLFIDCPYIISSKRPAGWKADPKIKAKFEKVKKTRETVRAAIEKAVEQANQQAGANRTFL